ncbi:MAG: hypothetical protein ACQEP7_03200 [bacterium]
MFSKKSFSIAIVLLGVSIFLFYLSPGVNAFDEYNVEEGDTPAEEPASSPEGEELEFDSESSGEEELDQEEPEEISPDQREQANPWRNEQDSDEEGLTARQVAEKTCEELPPPGEVEDSMKPLMRVQVTNMAFNIENEFFEFPAACDEIIQKWVKN